jgi:hypothetical protein
MSNIREDGRATLTKQAEWLKKYTNYTHPDRKASATSAARASTTSRSASVAPTRCASS